MEEKSSKEQLKEERVKKMGAVDVIPVISQFKSLVQAIAKNPEGARITQENFSRRCIVISQLRSLGEAIKGDRKAAKETQLEFLDFFLQILESLPVIGHIVGTVYYTVLKDEERGRRAMLSASRTVVVVGAGIGGIFVGGPVGALLAGAGGGAFFDAVATGAISKADGQFTPYGNVQNVVNVMNNPTDPAGYVELVFLPVVDGVSAMFTAKLVKTGINTLAAKKTGAVPKGVDAATGAETGAGKASKAAKGLAMAGIPSKITERAVFKLVRDQILSKPTTVKKALLAVCKGTKALMKKVRAALKEFNEAIKTGTEDTEEERTMFSEKDQSVKKLMKRIEKTSSYKAMTDSEQKQYKEAALLMANLDEEETEELLQALRVNLKEESLLSE